MKHQYYPYYQTKKYNDNFNKSYQRVNQYSTTSHQENNQLNNKDQSDKTSKKSNVKTSPCFSKESSTSFISNKTIPSSTSIPSIPQERESWIRSVKRTKLDENSTQKTQYLETMLRMPQPQKSSTNTSTFDRMRFANHSISSTINPIENINIDHNLDVNSFQLINNINTNEDICTIEKILFNNDLQSTTTTINKSFSSESNVLTNPKDSPWAGFLIDNCDDDGVMSPMSPPPVDHFSSSLEEIIQQNQEEYNLQNVMLVNEFNVADVEQRRELKRQKRFNKKKQKKNQFANINNTQAQQQQQINTLNSISNVNNNIHEESSSDWIIEYDKTETDPISQLTDMIKKTSTTTATDEDKVNQINLILKKIKQQQKDLRNLRQHLISMLDNEPNSNLTNTSSQQQQSHTHQDLLIKFLNQPTTSGCWLCSGKTYTEVETQCDNLHE